MIYADNAATTKLDPLALEAMLPFFQTHYGNGSSLYSFSRSVKKALVNSRNIIAASIGANPEEIFFTSGGTESNNWAIKGISETRKSYGKHIITSSIEHHAVLNPCVRLEQQGYAITYLPVDSFGNISKNELDKAIRPETIGISIMAANNEIGTLLDIPEFTGIAKKYKIPFHTDAVQAVGHVPIDVNTMGIDLLSASAHKFNGPKGVGFLFIRSGTSLANLLDGGMQENGNRPGTENIAGIVGMAVALKNNCDMMIQNTEKLVNLVNLFKQKIKNKIPSVVFNGDEKLSLPGHISLSIPGISGEALLHFLDLKGIAISTGAACNLNSLGSSHVLKAIDLNEILSKGTIRISFGKSNSGSDSITIAKSIVNYVDKILCN